MNKNQQKQEALKRMKLLKLYPNIIKEFEKDGIVNLSENGGILYWLDSTQKAIRIFPLSSITLSADFSVPIPTYSSLPVSARIKNKYCRKSCNCLKTVRNTNNIWRNTKNETVQNTGSYQFSQRKDG